MGNKMIILAGNPLSTNNLYKRHGNYIYLSSQGKKLKESYQWQTKAQWKGTVTSSPIKVSIKLYFGDKRKRDIDNYNKILLDALTGIIWIDDHQIEKMEIEKCMDKSNPRIELSFEAL